MARQTAAKMPNLIYGTAWKKDQTRGLVKQALLAGFRGVDTAAQPKHYQEELVGLGIRDAMAEAGLRREDLYIQTKFTSVQGQDANNIPYDPNTSITDQVKTSVASSLRNLRHTNEEGASKPYLDCLVLHSPFPTAAQTQEAWKAMESHVPDQARTLGISNIYSLPQLQSLYSYATVKPSVVQNRFYPATAYDGSIRAFCQENGIRYQSFWTLTANPNLLRGNAVNTLAKDTDVSSPVALYGLVASLGEVSILDGTTNASRMREDLEGIEKIRTWSQKEPERWQEVQKTFQAMLNV